jgi:hypothetical protein
MNRKKFLKLSGSGIAMTLVGATAGNSLFGAGEGKDESKVRGAIVLCNHWTESSIGATFPKGEINHRWYNSCFSTVFDIEQSKRWLATANKNRFCHELDMFFLSALEKEDPQYLTGLKETIDSGKMELVGGTFGQAESQVFGYESAIRQLSLGQAAAKKFLNRNITTYIVEEQSFYTQLPQILLQCGFKYASLEFQNSGTPDGPVTDLVWWKGPDSSRILTVPRNPGLSGCYNQWSTDFYSAAVDKMKDFKAPMIFQWLELWVPGMDWGASIDPYTKAINWAEENGFEQMTLTGYIEWAKSRTEPAETRFKMDMSNYDNNFFQGGWGYENERQARECNQCESLLLSAESLNTLIKDKSYSLKLETSITDGWPRLLISQCHDPYLAGSVLIYIDGLKTYQSELTVRECGIIRDNLQNKIGLHAAVKPGIIRLFNPCPWEVTSPVMLETGQIEDNKLHYELSDANSKAEIHEPLFRNDKGNLLLSPHMVTLPALGTVEIELKETGSPVTIGGKERLSTKDDWQSCQVNSEYFKDITIGPLAGIWKQIGLFFYTHPNINIEKAYNSLAEAPVIIGKRQTTEALDTVVWKKDLMRIKDSPEPALALHGMAVAGNAGIDFAEFQYRLESVIRLEVGPRPDETWQFQLRLPDTPVRIFADSPFAEEQREAKSFYCSRYIRFELPDRDILWCISQNTLFRNLCSREKGLFDCKVLDYAFNGVTNWGFRFYAAKKITPAQSMRLAESFHRIPVSLPPDCPPLKKFAITADDPDIVLFHTLSSPNGNGILLRTLNTSDIERDSVFKSDSKPGSVKLKDLLSETMKDNGDRIKINDNGWQYRFRPWEIATFEIRF